MLIFCEHDISISFDNKMDLKACSMHIIMVHLSKTKITLHITTVKDGSLISYRLIKSEDFAFIGFAVMIYL